MHIRDIRILDRQVGPVRMPLQLLPSCERWTARLRPVMAGFERVLLVAFPRLKDFWIDRLDLSESPAVVAVVRALNSSVEAWNGCFCWMLLF